MTVDLPRLRDLLGTPEAAWLLDRLVRRVEQGQALTGVFRIDEPSDAQREAWQRLTGEFGRGRSLRVDLDGLARQWREAGLAETLEAAVTALRGPIAVRKDVAQARVNAWDLAFSEPPPRAEDVWLELRRSGLVKRLVGEDPLAATALLRQAAMAVRMLPGNGLSVPALAAAVTGDAHALDPGKPLASVLLRVVRAWTGADPTDRRLAWASVGVEVDPLSSSVLVLGLRARGQGLVAQMLRACAGLGEPCRLTLRQLRREAFEVDHEVVFVCENPAVVLAAADLVGATSRPLLCVEGQPSSAARQVLAALGARVRYHGDFDWPGVRIAADVLVSTGGQPWRFDAVAYATAPKGLELTGTRAATPWDPALALAMGEAGRAVHEEAVLLGLLADLGA